ncbi:hypothetical protein WAI453_013544 [Rhynchosporium graminicola]
MPIPAKFISGVVESRWAIPYLARMCLQADVGLGCRAAHHFSSLPTVPSSSHLILLQQRAALPDLLSTIRIRTQPPCGRPEYLSDGKCQISQLRKKPSQMSSHKTLSPSITHQVGEMI